MSGARATTVAKISFIFLTFSVAGSIATALVKARAAPTWEVLHALTFHPDFDTQLEDWTC